MMKDIRTVGELKELLNNFDDTMLINFGSKKYGFEINSHATDGSSLSLMSDDLGKYEYIEEAPEPIKPIEDIMEELSAAVEKFKDNDIELLMSCDEDLFYINNHSKGDTFVLSELYSMNDYNRYDLKEACEEKGFYYREMTITE